MFNIGYYKAEPTTYVVRYHKGSIKQQGVGLSFFYFAPSTSLVAIPIASQDAPFMLKESKRSIILLLTCAPSGNCSQFPTRYSDFTDYSRPEKYLE